MSTDKQLDKTLNIGTEIRLAEGIKKHVKIGTIALIRQVREDMDGVAHKFSFSIGRKKWEATEDREAVDWPKVEETYKKAFNLVLVEEITEKEYEQIDQDGIAELDNLLDRFLF
ncbi:hypothetical protein P4H71_05105 [Paenibacillus kribbensis]|uniref:hypothetical protein n=1 Tax=Paenibacillus kribbensis TaxID=172713 RepID=UPI002DBEE92E|nr:hypothetical protein [Paenibacillus kribbensis]MEC0233734.1 hypothetical protein [Paenibacillus kribbensis]